MDGLRGESVCAETRFSNRELTGFHDGAYTDETGSAPIPANILLWLPYAFPCSRSLGHLDPRLRGAGGVRLRGGADDRRGPGQLRGSSAVGGVLSRRLEKLSRWIGIDSDHTLSRTVLPAATSGPAAAIAGAAADSPVTRAVRGSRESGGRYVPGRRKCPATAGRQRPGIGWLCRDAGTAASLSGPAAAAAAAL